jgi:hypothetical protein
MWTGGTLSDTYGLGALKRESIVCGLARRTWQLHDLALRVVDHRGGLVGAAVQRDSGDLVAADDLLLLGDRYPIPVVEVEADNADHLVGAAGGPGRLGRGRMHPDELVGSALDVGQEVVGDIVVESEQVTGVPLGRCGLRNPSMRQRCLYRSKIGSRALTCSFRRE